MKRKTKVIRINKEAYDELQILALLHDKSVPEMATECVLQYQELAGASDTARRLSGEIRRYRYDLYEKDN
jgi:hypothetical protein